MKKLLRILVVDDTKFIRDLVSKTIRTRYPEIMIDEAQNGRQAQSMLQKNEYSLVLCDWEMPEMSGIDLLQWVRGTPALEGQPFIMVTSLDEKEHVVEAVQKGVNDYMAKPFSGEQLITKMMKTLVKTGKVSRDEYAGMGRKERVTSGADAMSLLTGGVSASPKTASKKRRGALGKALLMYNETRQTVIVRDITTEEVSLVVRCADGLPGLAQHVRMGLVAGDEQNPAKVTAAGFIMMMQLAEKKPESESAVVKVQFANEEREVREQLSEVVSILRRG